MSYACLHIGCWVWLIVAGTRTAELQKVFHIERRGKRGRGPKPLQGYFDLLGSRKGFRKCVIWIREMFVGTYWLPSSMASLSGQITCIEMVAESEWLSSKIANEKGLGWSKQQHKGVAQSCLYPETCWWVTNTVAMEKNARQEAGWYGKEKPWTAILSPLVLFLPAVLLSFFQLYPWPQSVENIWQDTTWSPVWKPPAPGRWLFQSYRHLT